MTSDIKRQIQEDVEKNRVMVYIKGTPDYPQCDFSAQAVNILRHYSIDFFARDVLENTELRQAIKEFTGWPTLPQIFIDGEFIGGCDLLAKMHGNGELANRLGKLPIA